MNASFLSDTNYSSEEEPFWKTLSDPEVVNSTELGIQAWVNGATIQVDPNKGRTSVLNVSVEVDTSCVKEDRRRTQGTDVPNCITPPQKT